MNVQPRLVTVTGVLYPLFNQDSEDVVGVMLAAYDDTEYELEGAEHMDALIALCQQEVTVSGRIRFGGGVRILNVSEFEVTDHGGRGGPDASASFFLSHAG